MTREEIKIVHCLICGKETHYCMCGTASTTSKMPWDDLFDFSLYKKSQVTMKVTTYRICNTE